MTRRGFKVIGVIYQSWIAWDGDELVNAVPQDLCLLSCDHMLCKYYEHAAALLPQARKHPREFLVYVGALLGFARVDSDLMWGSPKHTPET